jgi:translation initiation factor 2 subunit 2
MADDYEKLLGEAFEKVKPCEFCDRFEVKKAEGMHEGNKTIVTNFCQIAGCLRRKPEHLAKFLLGELASPGNIDGDRLVLTRKLTSVQINEKIEKYSNLFVKCSNCGKPDTEIVKEGAQSFLKCMACGTKKIVHDL